MSKGSVVSYLYNGLGERACVHVNSYIYRLYYRVFIQNFFGIHAKYTPRYRVKIFPLHVCPLGSQIPLLFQYAKAFRNQEQEHILTCGQIFMKVMVKKWVLWACPSSRAHWFSTVLEAKIQRHPETVVKSRQKYLIDEYLFTLCIPPGESLNSYMLGLQGCLWWHVLISVWFD